VPQNRRPVPKEQKRKELLAAAAELFVVEGYDAASVSRIARAAGVTTNTLYWYFRDKDELLVAAAEVFLRALLTEHATKADEPLAEQLAWLVEQLRPIRHLVVTVHARIALSTAIAEWHSGFHETVEELFERQLPGEIPASARAQEAAAATFALEGAVIHDLDPTTTRQLCRSVAERLQQATQVAGRSVSD
jgi:AcrR family transcriptional regulator